MTKMPSCQLRGQRYCSQWKRIFFQKGLRVLYEPRGCTLSRSNDAIQPFLWVVLPIRVDKIVITNMQRRKQDSRYWWVWCKEVCVAGGDVSYVVGTGTPCSLRSHARTTSCARFSPPNPFGKTLTLLLEPADVVVGTTGDWEVHDVGLSIFASSLDATIAVSDCTDPLCVEEESSSACSSSLLCCEGPMWP